MMQTIFYDAHCHAHNGLNDAEKYVVNGTSTDDWMEIIETAKEDPRVLPAIGLHAWKIKDAPEDWQTRFLDLLPSVQAVGEVGLDGLCDIDMDLQIEAFCWQLKYAAQRNLPVSIHCLKAGDAVLRILTRDALPARGIHLHAYAGSAEQVPQFVELGAYFSFHAGQLDGNAKKAPQAIQAVPTDRLLIETDAPDSLKDQESHEDYLRRGYELAAELRDESLESFAKQVGDNFERYFLDN